MKTAKLKCFILILMAVLFLGSMARLFILRFESGDIYAPYSTLRSDPLGTKAFYKALERTHSLTVSRHYLPVEKLTPQNSTTLFVAGLPPYGLTLGTSAFDNLERFISEGGRLVLTFHPLKGSCPDSDTMEEEEPEEKKEPEKETPPAISDYVSLQKAWGFSLVNPPQKEAKAMNTGYAPIEESVFWPAPTGFQNLEPQWHPLLTKNNTPVVIERKTGSGSIVLCADSYLISNEAMKFNRAPLLLTWLTGKNTRIIFDEYHLGIRKSPGMASLIKKYRLHGFLMVLAVLVLLSAWKQSPPPALKETPDTSGHPGGLPGGKDDAAGLSSLLKRYIPEKDLLHACLKEWEKTDTAKQKITDKIHTLIASGKTDPVQTYRDICRMLLEEKHS